MLTIMKLRSTCCAITLAIATTLPLHFSAAQAVHGRVTAGAPTSAVVAGVIVELLDSTGVTVDRTLSAEAGQYRLRGRGNGRYRLRALRIGFRPTETAPFALRAGETIERSLPLSGLVVSLANVTVHAGQRCAAQPAAGSQAFDVWEEARKALDAALLTRERSFVMEIVRFERRMDARGANIVRESQSETRAPSIRPFVSIPGRDLDSLGYVVSDAEGTTYGAPDERVLLSEQFASTHCFRIGESADPGEVALRFEPIRGRKVPEISGSLVLARASAELRRLDFQYVNVPAEVRDAEAGGRVVFRRLPTGGWIVERWALRLPLFAHVTQQRATRMSDVTSGMMTRVTSTVLANVQESGGEVYEVASGASVVWSRPRPVLAGLLRDDRGVPVGHATVSLPTLGRATTTSPDGRFSFSSVRPGRRQITVAWPLTDSLGLAPMVREVDANGTDTVQVMVPSREAAFAESCNAPSAGELARIGFVRGVTRDASGQRMSDAQVVASWYESAGSHRDSGQDLVQRTLSTVSSTTGDYAVCGIPAGSVFVLQAFTRAGAGAKVGVRMPREGRVVLIDVPVPEPAKD